MKVKVIGKVLVFQSAAKMEDLVTLQKYNPKALELRDEEKNLLYTVRAFPGQVGSINNKGIVFDSEARTGEPYALLTTPACIAPEANAAEHIADKYGKAIEYITQIEAGIPAALDAAKAQRDTVKAAIEVL